MNAMHMTIQTRQSPKHAPGPCGDVVFVERDEQWTTVALVDGIGSGVRANMAALMAGHRMMGLLKRDVSLRETFRRLVGTMNDSRDPRLSFAAFSLARIQHDGKATILSYETPAPILLRPPLATLLDEHTYTLDRALLSEAVCQLNRGDAILLVSDGITQAGLGQYGSAGWGETPLAAFCTEHFQLGQPIGALPDEVHRQARTRWGPAAGDDCTVTMIQAGRCVEVTILTGPPTNRADDEAAVDDFLGRKGVKVVCGGSTAAMVARHIGADVQVEANPKSLIAPPRYGLRGIDLVTEGAVTLNQVCNILDEDVSRYVEDNGVTELASLLLVADRVNLLVGQADNPAADDLSYRQQGIAPRRRIVALLAEKLREKGKLVTVRRY